MMNGKDRKRKLSKTNREEPHSVDSPKKKHKTEAHGKENAEEWIGKKLLSGVFSWIVDVTTRNYFVDSAMSALNLGGHQSGRNKSRVSYNYQMESNDEEGEQRSSLTRRDLKRAPLSESYKKSQIYLTLADQGKSGRFSVRTENSISSKQSTIPLMEKRKVIENPFHSSQKFHKTHFHETSGVSAAEKMVNSKDVFELPLIPAMKASSSGKNVERSMPAQGGNGSKHSPSFLAGYFQYKKKGHTNDDVLALHEKDQYQMLLEHFTKFSVGSTFQKRDLPVKNKEVQTNLCGESSTEQVAFKKTLDPEASKFFAKYFRGHAYGISPTIVSDHKSPRIFSVGVQSSVKDTKNEDDLIISEVKVPQPSESSTEQEAFKKTLDPEASKFFAKYFKGHAYGISPTIVSDRKSPRIFRVGVQSSIKDTKNEDDLIISEVKVPQPRVFQTQSSPFSSEWLNELKKSFSEETEIKVKVIQQQEEKIKQFRESRAARLAVDDKPQEQLPLSGSSAFTEEVEDTSVEFPELTEKMEEIIDEALNPEPPEEVLCVGFNISVSRKDLETLAGLNWLNDEIIYFYMNLLMERSKNENYPSVYAFNTFFYPKLMNRGHSALKRWTRRVDIFSYDLILVPVHMGMHWCLAVIDFRIKKIRYYDSMGGQNTECLHALRDYLKDECSDKKGQSYDMTGWAYENVKNIPQQMNGSDCGMFTLKYAEYITRDAKITFTQDHMQYFRRRMVYEILTKQLL